MTNRSSFLVFDTKEGASECMFGAQPGEGATSYKARLRALWSSDHAAKQHLALYARYDQRRMTRYEGPMAEVAREVVQKIAQSLAKASKEKARTEASGAERSVAGKSKRSRKM